MTKKQAAKQAKKSASRKARKTTKTSEKPANAGRPMSGLDAAAEVLKTLGAAHVNDITVMAIKRGLWKPAGATPAATLASAITRDIMKHGKDSRFERTAPNTFGLRK